MANHTGSEGTVRIGATNNVAEIRSYTLTENGDTIEDTSMGDSSRTYRAGLKSWSGSVDCYWDETDTNGQNALTIGASVNLRVYPEGGASTATYYTGTALVTGITRQASFDGMVEASFTFQGTGALASATV